jgi:vacuolar-type H+-ATPase subunit E/Vma4
METADPATGSKLCEGILAEAASQCDEIRRKARTQAEAILAEARAGADQFRQETLAAAVRTAAAHREQLLAGIPIKTNRERARVIDSLLQQIRDLASRRLLDLSSFDYPGALLELTRDAMNRMPGEAFVVRLSPDDLREFGEALRRDIAARSSYRQVRFVEDPSVTAGVIVETSDASSVCDHRLTCRLERLWPEIRRQLAVQTALVSENDHSKPV